MTLSSPQRDDAPTAIRACPRVCVALTAGLVHAGIGPGKEETEREDRIRDEERHATNRDERGTAKPERRREPEDDAVRGDRDCERAQMRQDDHEVPPHQTT